ncbi:unnamed protein product [Dimorphilus gyrociliatus]|uniref:Uncharacterized protein n=1 Tax=Dimorphilus gyrociliatus TaxID=2664684 RepID=A0A7I8WCY0_9ANNE|nr:unnamed protein product [Dimorphilus gyrociliatus]
MVGSRKAGYLTQVAAKADKLAKKIKGVYLNVCNVHPGPGDHTEATYLQEYLPFIKRFHLNNAHHSILENFEREKDDYVYCMKEISKKLQTDSPILMLEDDGLPHDQLIEVSQRILESNWQFDYAKLFAKSEWNGFGMNIKSLVELLAMCSISIYLIGRRRILLTSIITIIMALVLSRQFLSQWRRISISLYTRVPAPDYGTVAVLYRKPVVDLIGKQFSNVKCSIHFPLDVALANFLNSFNLLGLLVQPNLAYHIGLYSSIKAVGSWPVDIAFAPSYI